MSKPVKELIVSDYRQTFEGLTGALLVDVRGVDANTNGRLRNTLAEKQVKVTVVKNSLARQAFEQTDLEALNELLQGSNAVVYPKDQNVSVVDVARELKQWVKQVESLQFKGALMDGVLFQPEQLDELSNFPTREEAQAQVVQILLTPAQKLAGAVQSPGQTIAGIIDEIRDRLEKGQTIEKVQG